MLAVRPFWSELASAVVTAAAMRAAARMQMHTAAQVLIWAGPLQQKCCSIGVAGMGLPSTFA